MKLLALLNGGAAVALVAYLGNVAGKNGPVPDVGFSMLCYLAGLVLCGFTFFASYLTQLQLYGESMGWRTQGRHTWPLRVAFSLGALSLIAFAVGSYYAAISFHTPQPKP